MAETLLTAIGLCKLIGVTGQAVYGASIKVANNFKKQRSELGGKVNGLKTRVERLEKKLDERRAVQAQSDNIKDMNSLLTGINDLFKRIELFFDKLEKYESQAGIVKLIQKTGNYYNIEHQFNDFNLMLDDLEKTLDKMQKDIGFDDLGDIRLAVLTLIQKLNNRSADFEDLINRIAKGFPDEKEFVVEYMRKLEFDRRRIAPDGNLPNPVRPHEITEEKSLSEGQYWTIHTAILDKEKVTVKRIRDVEDDNVKASFRKETVNLKRFFHGSIVRVIGMCDDEKEKFLVLEYMEKGDLSTLLHESGEKNINLSNKVNLAKTAALAFYCMSHKLVHSSLRTEKFLVDKYYTAKLSGMRYAKTFSSAKKHATKKPVVGVACYLAPEFQYKPGEPTLQADVYGFGIVLWEIFTQRKPFSTLAKEIGKEPNNVEVRKFVVDDEREEYDIGRGDIETKVGSIIRDCRALNPKNRPGVAEILDRLERLDIPIEDLED